MHEERIAADPFYAQIVSFGYTDEQSLLYGTPGGAVEVVSLIASGFLGYYTGNRILVSMIGLSIAIIGIILIVAVPIAHPGGRLAGYYMTQASPTPFVALLALISSNVAGYTKKTTVAAIYLICYCVGNIIGKSNPSSYLLSRQLLKYRILIQNSRPTNFPPLGRPRISTGRDHHHRLLGRLSRRPVLHLLLLPLAESEEGQVEGRAGLHQTGKSGISGSHRPRKSGIHLFPLNEH